MKKRRTAVCAFLLAACATLGMGYAALTDNLSVNGKLNTLRENSNLVVKFDQSNFKSEVTHGTTSASAVASEWGDTTVVLTFSGLTTNGDTVVAKLPVVNASLKAVGSELDATLSAPQVSYNDTNRSLYKVSAVWADTTTDGLTLEAARNDVSAGTNVLVVTLTLNQTVTTAIEQQTFTVSFHATTSDAVSES